MGVWRIVAISLLLLSSTCVIYSVLSSFTSGDLEKPSPAMTDNLATRLGLPKLIPLDGHEAEFQDAHSLGFFSNWLIPGKVMMGRYPFVNPAIRWDLATALQYLESLLKAGIITFVSLQAELPAQQDIPPEGISGFLPYRQPALEIQKRLQGRTLEFLRNPIVDFGIPSADQVSVLLEELVARLEKGDVIYIHCWGGRGRTGTIAAALLAKLYGLHSEDALRRTQKAFSMRGDLGGYCPETNAQRQFVRDYIRNHMT